MKENQKLDEESEIFNHKLLRAQEQAFSCYMKSIITKSNDEDAC